MLSSNTQKREVNVKPSMYAALTLFSLYGFILLLLLFLLGVSWLTLPIFIGLLSLAFYGAKKAHDQCYVLTLKEAGKVEVLGHGSKNVGLISPSSFYNGIFIFLKIELDNSLLKISTPPEKWSVVIYRDAVSESEYRLLARMINFGPDQH